MSDPVAVEFVAEVRQVKTMADRSANVTLNIPEHQMDAAKWFMNHLLDMVRCVVVIETKQDEINANGCKF